MRESNSLSSGWKPDTSPSMLMLLGAVNGVRTRSLYVGNVMLCQIELLPHETRTKSKKVFFKAEVSLFFTSSWRAMPDSNRR